MAEITGLVSWDGSGAREPGEEEHTDWLIVLACIHVLLRHAYKADLNFNFHHRGWKGMHSRGGGGGRGVCLNQT